MQPNSYSYSNWMEQTLDLSKTLKDISLPGSHDAGMYMSINCTSTADACNTQTQTLPVLGQLQAGIRYFDLRPVWKSGVLYTGHYGNVPVLRTQGCDGATLTDIFTDVSTFLCQGAKELVILKFSHYLDFDIKTGFSSGQFRTLINLIKGMLDDWLYPKPASPLRMASLPLSQIIGGSGKVIAALDELSPDLSEQVIYQYAAYSSGPPGGDLAAYDNYKNTNDPVTMKNDQFGKLDDVANHGGDLFVIDWSLELSDGQNAACTAGGGTSILKLSEQATAALPDLVSHGVTSATVPNVVQVNDSPTAATDTCVAINQQLGNNVGQPAA